MSGNSAPGGAALLTSDGSARVINCTIVNNEGTPYSMGAVGSINAGGTADLQIANSILWGNRHGELMNEDAQLAAVNEAGLSISSSHVQGWTGQFGGMGNSGEDPQLVEDEVPGRLSPTSPCIDAGDNNAVSEDRADVDGDDDLLEQTPWDVHGHPRFVNAPDSADTGSGHGPLVDIGAVEYIEDCNGNGVFDACELACGPAGGPCDVAGCGTAVDCDADGLPDSCEPDNDADELIDDCDADDDNDLIPDEQDNCPLAVNADQADLDGDGAGDACDLCPFTVPGAAVDPAGCPARIRGDMDRDGDVDQEDFGRFQTCLTGSTIPQSDTDCSSALLDEDDDVDALDVALFCDCFSGSNLPAKLSCAW